ncbi:endonuclease replication-associated protein [Yaravirus sp. 'brasiliensis']|uniref:Endonuclease replication-associated protein n=1 Tax=Yaravirus sp. 'brasiliensis' TaxID=2739681 RepID=A0AAE7B7Q5_9VIRU|nr:endonuclease replication-associated protein [Yaravirus brasiliensis]QKE44401.1 endonuclease replication-associated protein [Yaravirus brasiliensis]
MPLREITTRAMPHGARNHSGFLVTINTNRKAQTAAERDVIADIMRSIIHEMWRDQNVPRMVKFLTGPRDPRLIKAVDSEFAIEVGGHQGRVHAHVLTNIYHNSRIHLDATYIRDEVTDQLNEGLIGAGMAPLRGKVYVNIKSIKGDWSVLRYVRKTGTRVI